MRKNALTGYAWYNPVTQTEERVPKMLNAFSETAAAITFYWRNLFLSNFNEPTKYAVEEVAGDNKPLLADVMATIETTYSQLGILFGLYLETGNSRGSTN